MHSTDFSANTQVLAHFSPEIAPPSAAADATVANNNNSTKTCWAKAPMPMPIGMPAIPGWHAIIPAPAAAGAAVAAAVAVMPACACSIVCGGRDAALEMAPDTPEGWLACGAAAGGALTSGCVLGVNMFRKAEAVCSGALGVPAACAGGGPGGAFTGTGGGTTTGPVCIGAGAFAGGALTGGIAAALAASSLASGCQAAISRS